MLLQGGLKWEQGAEPPSPLTLTTAWVYSVTPYRWTPVYGRAVTPVSRHVFRPLSLSGRLHCSTLLPSHSQAHSD